MRKMTCKQLGGACDTVFEAATFEEIAGMSKQHAMEMFRRNDAAHLQAMQEMQALMTDPQAMQRWFEGKRKEFEALAEE